MTVLPWPAGRAPRRSSTPRAEIADPSPGTVLHTLVSDIPGPRGETAPERAARFEAQLAEVLSYTPRDAVEAMLAVQCVVLRLVTEDAQRDAARPGLPPDLARDIPRSVRQMTKLTAKMKRTLRDWQDRPLPAVDSAAFRAVEPPAPAPLPDPDAYDETAEAFSAIIVPLHPAPRMLQ